MSEARASLVILGDVVVRATPAGLERAEAIAIAGDRVVAVGGRADVLAVARPGAEVIDAGAHAVLPGLTDFHLHLVGMARARLEVALDEVPTFADAVRIVARGAERLDRNAWLRGRGWREELFASGDLARLDEAAGGRPALLYSHDAHSAWASASALRLAGIGSDTPDPPGGRIDRDPAGAATGVLRERATDLVDKVAERLGASALDRALDDTLAELASLGITGAVDAGDSSVDNGVGEWAALGDRASILLAQRGRLDGRLRLGVNVPASAIGTAAGLGLRTGEPLLDATTLRAGWAKAYVDGALGSRTAALFEPYSCGPPGETGIPRLGEAQLDEIIAAGRAAGIGLAIHAIGDRGAALVLDAFDRAPSPPAAAPPDRMEHLQLVRAADRQRLARHDITASVQPIHCASDRALVEACWQGREADAYPYRSLADAGARLAFGSDAPIESVNPWAGLFAAMHRRFAGDGTPDWQPRQALDFAAALAGYTSGPASAARRDDEGHLRVGARADVVVADADLAVLEAGDERLAGVHSQLTLVGGRQVHRA